MLLDALLVGHDERVYSVKWHPRIDGFQVFPLHFTTGITFSTAAATAVRLAGQDHGGVGTRRVVRRVGRAHARWRGGRHQHGLALRRSVQWRRQQHHRSQLPGSRAFAHPTAHLLQGAMHIWRRPSEHFADAAAFDAAKFSWAPAVWRCIA